MEDDEPEPRLRLIVTENSSEEVKELQVELIEKSADFLMDHLHFEGEWSLGLHVCGAAEMSELHEQFMGDDSPTDVMSFEGDEDDEGHLGDVIVCWDVAREESLHHDHGELEEAYFYVIHGILHLLGYDDQTPDEREEMHRLQKLALSQVGIILKS